MSTLLQSDLKASFDAELQRLLTRGLSQEDESLARRYYSEKERASMDEDAFCGPHRSFPVTSQADVDNAVRLVGHAENPETVKSCIKCKAKANGWSIPQSWKDESDRATEPVILRADGNHDAFTGSHKHAHPAYGSQGDDGNHEHDHAHDHDSDHHHSHDDDKRAAMPTLTPFYVPVTRIDREKREVWGVVTSEALDSFNTIFSYEGSKKAFQRWMERTANVREMHDRRAVGKGVGVLFDDTNKRIELGTRVSRGANDTWLKVEDGVLSGYSVGATKPTWGTIERDGKSYPYLLDYELTEVSLVDNPSNPDAFGLTIARADGLTEVVDITDPEPTPPPTPSASLERAGARISASTRDQLHSTIKSLQSTCGCEDCQKAAGGDDGDGDNQERMMVAIERALASVVARQHSILARFAQISEQSSTISLADIQATVERVLAASNQDKTYELLSTMQGQIERIAAQPQTGMAPILNGSRPVDKSLATDFRNQQTSIPNNATVMQNLQQLQAQGGLDTQELQQAAARLMLQMQQGR